MQLNRQSPYLRVILIGVDQLISAISNFLVIWLCLTSLPTETFGSFSYSWSTIALFVVLGRALFGIPALLDSEGEGPKQVIDLSSSLTGTLFLGGLTAIVTFLLYLLGGVNAGDKWIFGLFMIAPAILLQDQIRYLAIALKRIPYAIFLDLLVLFCILITVVLAKVNEFTGWYLIIGLTIGYLVASVIFISSNAVTFSVRKLNQFIQLDFERRSKLVGDAVLAWGFGLVAITLIRVATGDAGFAIYNGLVFLGLQAEVVRTKGNLAIRHRTLLVLISFSPILWTLVSNSAPEAFVEKFLGESTQQILANSIPFSISSTLLIGIEVLNLFMRAHSKFGNIAKIRLISGILSLSFLTLGLVTSAELITLIYILALGQFIGLTLTINSLRTEKS
ncbi:MAG: hypothetical protein NT032_08270 [Actinobacteria bacterium]|nr:hypothetical protein [Actinomycetota bacterium]